MKYQLQYPRWMKHPVVFLNEMLGIPLDRMKITGKIVIVNWDLDITTCEKYDFIVDEFDEKTIVIDIIGSLCQIITPIDDFLNQQLDRLCSYKIPGSEYFEGGWDGVIHLYRHKTKKFPVGYLDTIKNVIKRYLKGLGSVMINDNRPEPKKIKMPDKLIGIELRDYQVDAVKIAMEKGIGVLNACGGSGKTEIACEIIRQRATYTAFLVHRKGLLYQAKARLEERLGIEIGQVGDGIVNLKPVSIMMYQALSRYIVDDKDLMIKDDSGFKLEEDNTEIKNIKEILDYFSCVIADESIHLGARTFYRVLTAFDNCRYRHGLSASIDREDGQEMAIYAGVGTIIHKISASELIRRNFLVPPTINMIRIPPSDKVKRGDRYQTIYKNYIIENTVRNGRIVEEIYAMIKDGRKVLVLVDRIKHGDILKKMLEEYCTNLENPVDINLMKVKGELPSKLRNKTTDDFKAGKLDCVIATSSLYSEGIDLPVVSGLVIAGGGKCKSSTRQKVYRVLRIHPDSGKKDAKVIDCYDSANYLSKHSKRRLEVYWEEKEYVVNIE